MMTHTEITLPLFPLPVFLLPGGIARLRIFEPRYLKMVTIALKGQGFVILLSDLSSVDSPPWGSKVDIINFNQGDDGVLEIDVKCQTLVEIKSVTKDNQQLHFAMVKNIFHWSQEIHEISNEPIKKSLEQALLKDENLHQLYHEEIPNNVNWVVARWLELLPVSLETKANFALNYNFEKAKKFIQSIIY